MNSLLNEEFDNLRKKINASILDENFDNAKNLTNKLIKQSTNNNFYFSSWSYMILGYIESLFKNYDESIKYCHRSLALYDSLELKFSNCGHLSMCYSKLNNLDEALFYVNIAIHTSELKGDYGPKYEWYNFKANVLYKMNKYDEAIEFANKSIENIYPNFEETSDGPLLVFYQPFLTKFEIYLELNDKENAQKNYKILEKKFKIIKNPILHIRDDLKKYKNLVDKFLN